MIAYFDTSAFLPLLIDETSSGVCRDLWDAADVLVSSRMLFAEAAAAIARAGRGGRAAPAEVDEALHRLGRHWREVRKLNVDEPTVHAAAGRARRFGLTGYDAVHCASAEKLADGDLVAVSGDRRLLAAWRELGLRTFDPNGLN